MEKRLKPSLVLSSFDFSFSLHEYYLTNPNGGNLNYWLSNNISKFHEHLTVNETGIVILLRPLWVSTEKERLQCERYFSQLKHDIKIPNGENARNLVVNLVLKFHDDPTVNEFNIVVFLRHVWWSTRKERVLRGEGKKRKWGKEETSLVKKLT